VVVKISVIVPTYARSDLLARLLESLARQTFAACDFELIVADDGSPPDTERVVQTFAATAPMSVIYLRQPNAGPARARNLAISRCAFDWIAMTDDDCVADPGWLSAVVGAIERNPEAVAVEGKTVCPDRHPLKHFVENLEGQRYWTANMAFSRKALLAVGGFDGDFPHACNEDIEIALKIQKVGEIVWCPEALIVHPARNQPLMSFVRRFTRQIDAEWVLYRKHPVEYRQVKPLGTPSRTLVFLLLLQPLSTWRRWGGFFLTHPADLLRFVALTVMERAYFLRDRWRRWTAPR
jgi:glycosyltransferase involved in cell wall biosynthesis